MLDSYSDNKRNNDDESGDDIEVGTRNVARGRLPYSTNIEGGEYCRRRDALLHVHMYNKLSVQYN